MEGKNRDITNTAGMRIRQPNINAVRRNGIRCSRFEILRMILEARTTDEIASAFHVSRKTVANYHYNIKSKLGVSSDIELLYFGLQHGVIKPIAPLPDLEK